MFNKSPTPINSTTRCEPPQEKNGKGIPANGNIPATDEILINAWNVIQNTIPMAVIFENLSFEFLAIFKPSQKNKIKIPIKAMQPIAPISSPIMAKIESDIAWGRNPNFWVDIPNPFPKIPPDPRDISDWRN